MSGFALRRPRVFVAGAGGAIGRRLLPQLIGAGYTVFGTTRSAGKSGELQTLGATPLVVDVFDTAALAKALHQARPDVVMHQLTNLPKILAGAPTEATLRANARLRNEGTQALIDAAIAAGARRFIAQSIAWIYAPGPQPHGEEDPLDREATGSAAITVAGVIALERMTLGSPPLAGTVLRYGQLYGPGTWHTSQNGRVPVHVDAAKARRELGWNAGFRLRC